MDISINWLNNILNVNVAKKNVRELDKLLMFYGVNPNRLTLSGFEVEQLYYKKINNIQDIIIEIDTTPNRRDLNSIIGICQELSTLLHLKLQKKKFYATNVNFLKINTSLSKTQTSAEHNRDIIYVQLHNINFCLSPKWLESRLKTHNIDSVNFFDDLTSYIQLEWGQTIQFYDFDKIKDFNFHLSKTKRSDLFHLPNNQSINLSDCQTVSNLHQTLSICGILENDSVRVNKKTKSLLIECISYASSEIRANRIHSQIKTPRSLKSEKINTNISMEIALQRILKLLSIYWPKIRVKTGPIFLRPLPEKIVHLRYESVRQVLGKSNNNAFLTNKEINLCLQRLNFPLKVIESDLSGSYIPALRYSDIDEEIDLVEEIGRMYGFNNFQSQRPKFNKIGKITLEQRIIDKFKNFAIYHGFYELINYSFSNNKNNTSYHLLNPISSGNALQQNLSSNLIETIKFNLNQQNKISRGFEVARIFHKNKRQEATFFSGFISNETYKSDWGKTVELYSWPNLKDLLINIMAYVGLKNVDWIPLNKTKTRQFHPNRTAILSYKKKTIGLISQIHPSSLKLNSINGQIFLFEFNATLISQIVSNQNFKQYESFRSFPSLYRDISFTVKSTDLSSRYELFFTEFINKSTTLVHNMYLKDSYEFYEDCQKYKTLTYSFVFQSKFRTLKTEEIDNWMKKLEFELSKSNDLRS